MNRAKMTAIAVGSLSMLLFSAWKMQMIPVYAMDTCTTVVHQGDALWAIAQRHGTETQKIIQLNPQIQNPNLIHPGDVVHVCTNSTNPKSIVLATSLPTWHQKFVCLAYPFVQKVQKLQMQGDGALPHPWHTSAILAQWAIEQGWTMPGYTGYNFGNVSAINGYPSTGGTGQWGSPSGFAYAHTPDQGIEEYVIFTKMGYYRDIADKWDQGAEAQAWAIGQSKWDAGRYTTWDANHTYMTQPAGTVLVNGLHANNLTQFDTQKPKCD